MNFSDLTFDQGITFAIIAAAIVLFIWDRWRYDVIALLCLLAATLAGVVPAEKAFTGFADPVVITVALVLVMSAAISRSGFIDWILAALSRFTRFRHLQVAVLAGMVMALSSFMNNVGALAVFLPIVVSFAKKAERPASELLMPISFASLLGGLVTLIGTPPNLLISGVRKDLLGAPYEMFDFAPVGLCICALGIIYLAIGWHLLPKDRKGQTSPEERFAIDDYVSEARVIEESPFIGQEIREIEALMGEQVAIVGLIRDEQRRLVPSGRLKIREGDLLLIESASKDLRDLIDKGKLELVGSKDSETISVTSDEVGTVEAIITTGSQLVNRTPRNLRLRERFGVNLLAVRRVERRFVRRLSESRLDVGEIVVLQGNRDTLAGTLEILGCLPLAERNLQLGRPKRFLLPMAIMVGAIALTVAGVMPISIAFLGGVLLMAILRILRLEEMYEAVDWSILVLLGALIPVTEALRTTGGTEIVADLVTTVTSGVSPTGVLAIILVASMMITPFLNNAATVLLMAPIAGSIATKLGVSVDAFLMAVAVGTSCDFLTPIGHQSNTLVMGPGGYKFGDYWRLGLPLSILVVAAGVPLILWAWPL